MFESWLTGLLLSFSLIVAIGAQNAYVLRQGLRREHVGVAVALCAGIDLLLIAAGVSGVARAAALQPRLLQAIAWLGAAFLFWYGLQAARRAWRPHSLTLGQAAAPKSVRQVATETLAVTLLNPHVYLDTVLLVGAVGAQQLSRGAFVAGAALASLLWFVGLGLGARWLVPWFAKPVAWRVLDAAVALTMWAVALSLLAPLASPMPRAPVQAAGGFGGTGTTPGASAGMSAGALP
jgi:L-lysine exporter family protein LysE/ArgO